MAGYKHQRGYKNHLSAGH